MVPVPPVSQLGATPPPLGCELPRMGAVFSSGCCCQEGGWRLQISVGSFLCSVHAGCSTETDWPPPTPHPPNLDPHGPGLPLDAQLSCWQSSTHRSVKEPMQTRGSSGTSAQELLPGCPALRGAWKFAGSPSQHSATARMHPEPLRLSPQACYPDGNLLQRFVLR